MKLLTTAIAMILCVCTYAQQIIKSPHIINGEIYTNEYMDADIRYKYTLFDTSYAIIVYVVKRAAAPLQLKADYGMVIDTLIREDWLPHIDGGFSEPAVPHAYIKPSTLIGTPIYEQYKIIAGGKPVALDMVVAIIPKQKPKK